MAHVFGLQKAHWLPACDSAALAQFLMGANNLTELDVSNASASLEVTYEAIPFDAHVSISL
jgi:hypothetical protein